MSRTNLDRRPRAHTRLDVVEMSSHTPTLETIDSTIDLDSVSFRKTCPKPHVSSSDTTTDVTDSTPVRIPMVYLTRKRLVDTETPLLVLFSTLSNVEVRVLSCYGGRRPSPSNVDVQGETLKDLP